MKHLTSRCACYLLTVWFLASASFAADHARPNVLLIVSDDQRPDTIHALGNSYIATPNLDRLVERGTAFPRAIAPIPHCTPSRAEIMTGATTFQNRSSPIGKAIAAKMIYWATTMRQGGYHTWYSGKWMNDGSPKTRGGYEETSGLYSSGGAAGQPLTYPHSHNEQVVTGYTGWTFKTNDGKVELEKGIGLTPITDRHIADGAIALINRRSSQPFFLHVNFTAPHDPLHLPPGYEKKYDPATMPLPANFLPEHPFDHGNAGQRDELMLPVPRDPMAVKGEIAAYYSLISHMDEQIGRILAALEATGQDKNTIIIFTSDHGLGMGSHGLMGKTNMYEHTIGVPLIIAGPGVPAGRRSPAQTYLRDLYPTVCELVGLTAPATVEGKSLVPVLQGRTEQIYPEVYGYWHRPELTAPLPVQRMVRTERWKLIYYSNVERFQLFDLANDPYELKDLSSDPSRAQIKADLRAKLDAWFKPRLEKLSGTSAKAKAASL
jgi:arylsulfatase A-like enzyme